MLIVFFNSSINFGSDLGQMFYLHTVLSNYSLSNVMCELCNMATFPPRLCTPCSIKKLTLFWTEFPDGFYNSRTNGTRNECSWVLT